MSGKCYKWASNWNVKNSDYTHDEYSASDSQSEYADARSESNSVEESSVRERMRKLFELQSFTDVTFYPKNNRKVSVSAHRAILAIGSPLFAKMLYDDQTKVCVSEKLEVQINNLSFDAFTSIVKYLYTDEVSFENDAVAQGILDAAKQFGIHSLVNKCKEYFENVELTSDNVCTKLQMCTSNKESALKERCMEFIQKNTLSVVQSTEFQKCTSTTVRAICKLQSLNLRSEAQLLEAVMRWLHSQPYQERMVLLEPLLKCIRFLSLTVGEMVDALERYKDLMTADEGLSIIRFLTKPSKNPDFSFLPSWCNKNTQSRCFFDEDNVRGSQTGLNVVGPAGNLVGKIFFPLTPDPRQGFVSKLTSHLQLKCISGFHEVRAIRLSFEKPISDKCKINNLLIKVHRSPSAFVTTENVQIVNSESVRVEFRKKIKVRQGDTLDIEAEARKIEFYKFLWFDETTPMPTNPHFRVCPSSSPVQGQLYFISEIEYGPQKRFHKFSPKYIEY